MPQTHTLRGVLLFVFGVFLFACMDTATKYLATYYQVPLIVAIRYVVHFLLMVLVLAPTVGRQLVQTQRTGLVLVRAACLAAGSMCFGFALQRMPVGEATAVLFLAPLLVVLLSGPLLKERVGVVRWSAAIAGFGGILLIARPGDGLDAAGIGFALAAAACTSGYQVLSRVLASTERTLALLFFTALVGAVAFGLAAPWFWEGRVPTPLEAALFLSLGACGGLGHYLFTAAHRHAPPSALAPLMYAQLVWATLLGWVVFGHVPDGPSIAGMAIVAAAGATVALQSRKASRALEEAAEV